MKSTAQAIEILTKVSEWANSSYAHLSNREGYPRGYREGIANAHQWVGDIIGNDIADVISALNEDSKELAELREENETLRKDNRDLDEMRDGACRSANRANIEINKLLNEKRLLLIELAKIKIVHGLELTPDEKAAVVTALTTLSK